MHSYFFNLKSTTLPADIHSPSPSSTLNDENVSCIIDKKWTNKLSNNPGQNIWKLFHSLAQFLLTTSETEPDYYHQKVNELPHDLLNDLRLTIWGN